MSARDRLERCKNLLEQVVSELEDNSSSNSSTSPATPRSTNSSRSSASLSVEASPSTSTSASSTKTVSIHEEHRRLFGFNSRGRRYSPFSQAGSGGLRNRASTNRLFKKPTWTRNFVCLASSEAVCPPNSTQYLDLRKAGLGEQKITLNITDGPLELDLKLKETFPKLEKSGGYSLMRTQERGSRVLVVLNGPYSVERLKMATGQGKIYIKPLQCDLSLDAVESGNSVEGDLLETCLKCKKFFYLAELAAHIEQCSIASDASTTQQEDVLNLSDDQPSSSQAQDSCSYKPNDQPSSSQAQGSSYNANEPPASSSLDMITNYMYSHSPTYGSCSSEPSTSRCHEESHLTLCPTSDLHHLTQMFPDNDSIYLKQVLQDCGSVSKVVAKILGDEETLPMRGSDIADEEEDIPLAAASITTVDEDTEALVKFTRVAVKPFEVEMDLRVTREQDILPQMIRKYKNPAFDVTKPLNVEFVGLGENGVDAGGVTREYFNLLMEGIKQRSSNGIALLEGNLGHLVPIHDYELLSSGLFIIMGKMILHAVLNNCTGISGISPAVVKYIATGRRDSAVEVISLDDIPDPCLKEQLEQLLTCDEKDLPSFTSAAAAENFLDMLNASGFPYLEITARNRSLAYECFLLYEVITKRIAALEDIRKGLASVRVRGITLLDLLRVHPNLIRYVFPQHCDKVDLTLFKLGLKFEEAVTEAEKLAQTFMQKYIEDVVERDEDSGEEMLQDLLQFWTGFPQLPRDNSCKLLVKYCPQEPTKVLAEADTCTVTLRIPTIHQQYEDFGKFMDRSVAHGKVGFGRL